MEVAAAGGHHLLLHGPPGAGKTLLAAAAADRSCPAARAGQPSRSPPCTRWPGCSPRAARCSRGRRSRHPTTRRRRRRWSEAAQGSPVPVRCRWRTAACSSSTRLRSSGPTRSRPCASPSSPASWSWPGRRPRVTLPGPVPARPGREPVPLRPRARPVGRLPLHADAGAALRGSAVRPAARPHRPPGRGRRRPPGDAARRQPRGRPRHVVAARVLAARARAALRLADTPWTVNAEVPGPYLRARLPLPRERPAGGCERRVVADRPRHRPDHPRAWTLADLAGRELPDEDDVGAPWSSAWAAARRRMRRLRTRCGSPGRPCSAPAEPGDWSADAPGRRARPGRGRGPAPAGTTPPRTDGTRGGCRAGRPRPRARPAAEAVGAGWCAPRTPSGPSPWAAGPAAWPR